MMFGNAMRSCESRIFIVRSKMGWYSEVFVSTASVAAFLVRTHSMARLPSTSSSQRNGSGAAVCADAVVGSANACAPRGASRDRTSVVRRVIQFLTRWERPEDYRQHSNAPARALYPAERLTVRVRFRLQGGVVVLALFKSPLTYQTVRAA